MARPFSLLVLIALVSTGWALTENGRSALQRLKAALAEEQSSRNEGGNRRDVGLSLAAQLATLLERDDGRDRALEILAQASGIFPTGPVATEIAALQTELTAAQKADEERARKLVADNIEAARKAVEQAKQPSDLDATLGALGNLRKELAMGQQNSRMRPTLEDANNAQRFVTLWQNYLAARGAGNMQGAAEALRGLANSESATLLPRSRILEALDQANPPPKPEAKEDKGPDVYAQLEQIASGTKSLEDIPRAMLQLRQLRSGTNITDFEASQAVGALNTGLEEINRSYQNFKAGLAANVAVVPRQDGSATGGEIVAPLLARLRMDLLLLTLPRYVGAPEDTKARPGETPEELLARLTKEGNERGDYATVQRAGEARRLYLRSGAFSKPDADAYTALIAGQNQEAAGQFMLAVVSYQAALNTGSELVPAKAIGERLASLKKDHPEDFAAGMEQFLALRTLQPDPRQLVGPGGRPYTGPPPPFGIPGPSQPPQPALLIPPVPATTNPAGAAKAPTAAPATDN